MRILPIICMATIAFTCGVAGAQPNRIDSIRTPRSPALTEFWTQQRLQDAKQMPVPVVDAGTVGTRGPAEPKAGALRSGQSKRVPASAARAAATMPMRPHWWVGTILFVTSDGAIMTCAADLVAPGIALTAAHCLRDHTGKWFSNIVYVFDYQRGSGRRIPPECFTTYNGWVSEEPSRWAWDFGLVKIRGGTNIGHFGWEYGWWGKHESAARISRGPNRPADQAAARKGTLVKGWDERIVGLKHDAEAVGSGGDGWIARHDEDTNNPQSNHVISVTSHHVGDDRSTSYGPYWDDGFARLMDHAARGCR